ncbi:13225_t:CDS:2, partial [Entrophospora sp. SA101]
ANGLCKVCYFYFSQQQYDRILNKNFIITEFPTKSTIPPSHLALQIIYKYQNFRWGQLEAIESFVNNKDTLVLLPTGSGKTLCYSIGSLLTIILSPLKALIEDQVIELVCSGIPSAGLYAASDKPPSYQEQVFSEIASKLVQIIYLTPEKFVANKSFQNMLKRISVTSRVQFVIDESHCVLEHQYFRNAWNGYSSKKKTQLTILTAFIKNK